MLTPLEAVFDEVRRTFHRLVQASEQLHKKEDVTLGMRGVLEFLDREGDHTVPQIARSRHVSRQHIQGLVNPLLDLGLVQTKENVHHKSSPLITLTEKGCLTFNHMRSKERRLLKSLDWNISQKDLRTTAEVLRKIDRTFGNDHGK